MKPFDLEAAKAGKPVCTRDGREARIVCFDRIDNTTQRNLVVLIQQHTESKYSYEYASLYNNNGKEYTARNARGEIVDNDSDLMMKSEKHEGWVILYRQDKQSPITTSVHIYATKENAESVGIGTKAYIGTAKIEWED